MQRLLRVRVGLAALLGATALVWSACGSDSGPTDVNGQTGAVQVSASTTGDDLDSDGYTVTLNGGSERAIARDGSTTFSGVATGQHQVGLAGLADNCSVSGSNPASVSVTSGNTAQVTFAVVCEAPTGLVQVSTSTSGDDLDPDGYTVTLDGGSDRSIGLNGVTTFTDVAVGSHQVALSGLADNCSVDGSNPASTAVTAGETAQVSFDVTCEPLPVGSLEITTAVANNFDPDGFQVLVAGANQGTVEVNGSATFDELPAGAQLVELTGIAPNCAVDGDNPASVEVPVGGTGTHAFSVTCTNPPDGRIVYLGAPQGTWGISVMNTDGSGRILVFEYSFNTYPQWSPDGSKIAFAMVSPDLGISNIYTINQDGSGLAQVTDFSNGDSQHPAWSPDGTKILFDHQTEISCCPPAEKLFVVNADGTGLTEIPRDNPMRVEDEAGWSPDGTQIVFTAHAQEYEEPGIFVMDAAGGTATKISEDPPGCDAAGRPDLTAWSDGFVGGRLEWSADGARILFTRWYRDVYQENGDDVPCVPAYGAGNALLAMNPDGTDVTFIAVDPDGYADKPSWSPDGSKILYEGPGVFHVINADGTGDVAIPVDSFGLNPDWGP
jgi:Tol biopolymer transport system component